MTKKRVHFPPTTAQQRKFLFETWEETGNVTQACRKAHIDRGKFLLIEIRDWSKTLLLS